MLSTAPGDEHVAVLDRWYEIEIGWIAWLQNSDATVPFFKWFTDAALHSTLLVSAAVLFLVNWRKGCILLWVYFVGNSVNILLKMTFGTPRPYWLSDQIQAHVGSGSFGFPSGHVFITSSVWITIAYLFPNRWTLIGSGLATLLVAFSRVYLGVHFVIDVVAGVVFALILAWCCSREGFWDRILSNFSLSGQLLFLSLVLLVSSTVWFAWLSIQGDIAGRLAEKLAWDEPTELCIQWSGGPDRFENWNAYVVTGEGRSFRDRNAHWSWCICLFCGLLHSPS